MRPSLRRLHALILLYHDQGKINLFVLHFGLQPINGWHFNKKDYQLAVYVMFYSEYMIQACVVCIHFCQLIFDYNNHC